MVEMISKILFVNASPRKQNCKDMIDFAIPFVEKNKFIHKTINLSEKNINFCKHCDFCKSHESCVIDDDCNNINKELADADALIFVTPVYFGSMTGQLKTMIDRTLPLRRNGFRLKDKIGSVFTVGGSRNGGQELTILDVMAFMHIHGMIVVGDDNHFGATGYSPFSKDKFGQETVKSTTEKVCRLLNSSG